MNTIQEHLCRSELPDGVFLDELLNNCIHLVDLKCAPEARDCAYVASKCGFMLISDSLSPCRALLGLRLLSLASYLGGPAFIAATCPDPLNAAKILNQAMLSAGTCSCSDVQFRYLIGLSTRPPALPLPNVYETPVTTPEIVALLGFTFSPSSLPPLSHSLACSSTLGSHALLPPALPAPALAAALTTNIARTLGLAAVVPSAVRADLSELIGRCLELLTAPGALEVRLPLSSSPTVPVVSFDLWEAMHQCEQVQADLDVSSTNSSASSARQSDIPLRTVLGPRLAASAAVSYLALLLCYNNYEVSPAEIEEIHRISVHMANHDECVCPAPIQPPPLAPLFTAALCHITSFQPVQLRAAQRGMAQPQNEDWLDHVLKECSYAPKALELGCQFSPPSSLSKAAGCVIACFLLKEPKCVAPKSTITKHIRTISNQFLQSRQGSLYLGSLLNFDDCEVDYIDPESEVQRSCALAVLIKRELALTGMTVTCPFCASCQPAGLVFCTEGPKASHHSPCTCSCDRKEAGHAHPAPLRHLMDAVFDRASRCDRLSVPGLLTPILRRAVAAASLTDVLNPVHRNSHGAYPRRIIQLQATTAFCPAQVCSEAGIFDCLPSLATLLSVVLGGVVCDTGTLIGGTPCSALRMYSHIQQRAQDTAPDQRGLLKLVLIVNAALAVMRPSPVAIVGVAIVNTATAAAAAAGWTPPPPPECPPSANPSKWKQTFKYPLMASFALGRGVVLRLSMLASFVNAAQTQAAEVHSIDFDSEDSVELHQDHVPYPCPCSVACPPIVDESSSAPDEIMTPTSDPESPMSSFADDGLAPPMPPGGAVFTRMVKAPLLTAGVNRGPISDMFGPQLWQPLACAVGIMLDNELESLHNDDDDSADGVHDMVAPLALQSVPCDDVIGAMFLMAACLHCRAAPTLPRDTVCARLFRHQECAVVCVFALLVVNWPRIERYSDRLRLQDDYGTLPFKFTRTSILSAACRTLTATGQLGHRAWTLLSRFEMVAILETIIGVAEFTSPFSKAQLQERKRLEAAAERDAELAAAVTPKTSHQSAVSKGRDWREVEDRLQTSENQPIRDQCVDRSRPSYNDISAVIRQFILSDQVSPTDEPCDSTEAVPVVVCGPSGALVAMLASAEDRDGGFTETTLQRSSARLAAFTALYSIIHGGQAVTAVAAPCGLRIFRLALTALEGCRTPAMQQLICRVLQRWISFDADPELLSEYLHNGGLRARAVNILVPVVLANGPAAQPAARVLSRLSILYPDTLRPIANLNALHAIIVLGSVGRPLRLQWHPFGNLDPCIRGLFSRAGLRLWSLDGGGIRGLSENAVVERVSTLIGVWPWMLCDAWAGTSTGSLVGMALFTRSVPSSVVRMLFNTLAQHLLTVSPVQRITRLLTSGFRKTVETHLSELYMKFIYTDEPLSDTVWPNIFVPATSETVKNSYFVFRNWSWPSNGTGSDNVLNGSRFLPVWQAVRSSTAAPGMFKPFTLETGHILSDGGTNLNNPAVQLLLQMQRIYPTRRIDSLVSVGNSFDATGVTENISTRPGSWFTAALRRLTDIEPPHRTLVNITVGLGIPYYRINPTQGGAYTFMIQEYKDYFKAASAPASSSSSASSSLATSTSISGGKRARKRERQLQQAALWRKQYRQEMSAAGTAVTTEGTSQPSSREMVDRTLAMSAYARPDRYCPLDAKQITDAFAQDAVHLHWAERWATNCAPQGPVGANLTPLGMAEWRPSYVNAYEKTNNTVMAWPEYRVYILRCARRLQAQLFCASFADEDPSKPVAPFVDKDLEHLGRSEINNFVPCQLVQRPRSCRCLTINVVSRHRLPTFFHANARGRGRTCSPRAPVAADEWGWVAADLAEERIQRVARSAAPGTHPPAARVCGVELHRASDISRMRERLQCMGVCDEAMLLDYANHVVEISLEDHSGVKVPLSKVPPADFHACQACPACDACTYCVFRVEPPEALAALESDVDGEFVAYRLFLLLPSSTQLPSCKLTITYNTEPISGMPFILTRS